MKFSYIYCALRPDELTLSVHEAVLPGAIVASSVRLFVDAVSIVSSVSPLAFVASVASVVDHYAIGGAFRLRSVSASGVVNGPNVSRFHLPFGVKLNYHANLTNI